MYSSEDPKLALREEAEKMLFPGVSCLCPHSSAFIASSHSRFAKTLAANWIWNKRWCLVSRKYMLIQV